MFAAVNKHLRFNDNQTVQNRRIYRIIQIFPAIRGVMLCAHFRNKYARQIGPSAYRCGEYNFDINRGRNL